jgi:hypothetical protein
MQSGLWFPGPRDYHIVFTQRAYLQERERDVLRASSMAGVAAWCCRLTTDVLKLVSEIAPRIGSWVPAVWCAVRD